ncbi:iron-containing alcohol dehydrogenase [Desulfovibrio ferrophilus]|uniref:Iron-containing alcohol dehydrogenase n=1 Tax=Desulfovibrio ferrophilus TaxID=241368 RepID=A0A2Z6AUT1_9BACT|nr:iron-containing alcohol dehydrogenase [Desulfovibrio ferrophilus]BBD06991.1 iron-containing alcohol dehydrogenase [Desulfovibrio ferrophilus]
MNNFTFHIPTQVHFGVGQIAALPEALKAHGATRVLLAYGGGSIKKYGVYDEVVRELNNAGLPFAELTGIQPNPRVESVREGITMIRDQNLDFILAVGGGSVIDCCKAIAAGAPYLDGDVMDLLTGKAMAQTTVPLGTVLTLAATGSELNNGAVITAGEDHKKLVLFHPGLFPRFSILDPAYTATLPPKQTAAGAADILCHLMEQYFNPAPGTQVQDRMNEGLMRVVLDNAETALAEPDNLEARANLLWASSMALAGLQLMLGKPMAGFPIHFLGHELSSLNDMTHGVSLALLTPAWMRLVMRENPENIAPLAAFARNVMDVTESDDMTAAQQGIKRLEDWYKRINMPANLREAGVPEDKLRYLADKVMEGRQPFGPLTPIDANRAEVIFREAF